MIEYEAYDAASPAQGFQLTGRLDSAGVELVEAPLTELLRTGSGPVLFDLSKISFVGSLGIRLLISASRLLQRQGRQLGLFGMQTQVAEVFETVALSDLITMAGSEAEVIRALDEDG